MHQKIITGKNIDKNGKAIVSGSFPVDMTKEDEKKIKTQALAAGRARYGAKKELVEILKKANTDKTLANLTGKLEYAGTNIRNITFGEYAYIGVAKSVSSSRISFYDKDTVVGTTADSKITIDKDTTFVCNEDGEKLSLSGIKEGFIVKYFYNDTDKCYNVMTFNRTEIGDVTSRSSTKIEVDDEEFTVNFIGSYSKPSLDN